MWAQDYLPVADSLILSAFAASIPLVVLGLALGVWRVASWKASLIALLVGTCVALGIYGMPPALVAASVLYGAAFGLFPIGWLVFPAILLFDVVVESGRFGALRQSLADISPDARIQALLIAFVFGAFLEGAAGAGAARPCHPGRRRWHLA
jgi:lactate permease